VAVRPDLRPAGVALLLLALVEAGLLDALASVAQSAHKALAVRATVLLADCLSLLRQCVSFLPMPLAVRPCAFVVGRAVAPAN
jgi:hypothetical protein